MKEYNYKAVKEFIKENKEIISSVYLGIQEDWFWTAEEVWSNGKYRLKLNDKTLIAGIKGSSWATPVMRVEYKEGFESTLECSAGDNTRDGSMSGMLGCLSGPVQENIAPVSGKI